MRQFGPTEVQPTTWAKLKLLSGDLAEALQDMDSALAEYAQALATSDLQLKARAYHKRGRVFKMRNVAEALAHYETCIQLSADAHLHAQLVAASVDAAWVYMEDYRDFARAAEHLQRAEVHLPESHAVLVAKWHNAQGEWHHLQQQYQAALAAFLQARLAALESQDVELQLNVVYNLGTCYAALGRFPEALGYLQEGRTLAVRVGDRNREGRCNKGLGEYYYWLGDYQEAVNYYTAAYAIFAAMHNQLWLTGICYDLAEAWSELGLWEQARRYYQEGIALTQTLEGERYRAAFQELASRFLVLQGSDLTTRTQQILAGLQAYGALTSQECAQLLGLSKEQTLRELQPLIKRGMIIKQGKGPKTQYRLADS
ncbi:hypothetical protein CJ255_10770 [Candidatus Viridilinea mediisalina]|uniref:Uncharacterized protein n=1 Tax=Candidatus Viridilinea mediisalina TaxID=2024553 RepID=A0A2A6RJE5_9CHLR|nr:hypothetical protein CJ255_10770 [Candidatus Viridilinea mediisalina]